jgi:hypothetical protein
MLRHSSDVYSTHRFANRIWTFASVTEAAEYVVSRGSVQHCGKCFAFSTVTFGRKSSRLSRELLRSARVCHSLPSSLDHTVGIICYTRLLH